MNKQNLMKLKLFLSGLQERLKEGYDIFLELELNCTSGLKKI